MSATVYSSLLPALQLAPESNRSALRIPGDSFTPVDGSQGQPKGSGFSVTSLNEDHATLVSRVELRATDYPILKYTFQNQHPGYKTLMFWRSSESPERFDSIELPITMAKSGSIFLASHDRWAGSIVEIAILIKGDLRERDAVISHLEFLPPTKPNILTLLWGELFALRTWTQRSTNQVAAAQDGAISTPVAVVNLWVASALLLYVLTALYKRVFARAPKVRPNAPDAAGQKHLIVLSILCVGWLILDLLWQNRLLFQAKETQFLFANKTIIEKKMADVDRQIFAEALELRKGLQDSNAIVWLFSQNPKSFEAVRLKYHLTPSQSFYYKDSKATYKLMRRFGAAEKGQVFVGLKPFASGVRFNARNNVFKFHGYCAIADKNHESELTMMITLRESMKKC